ncbi:Caspase domain-containing protein [Lentzea waywayandensis]|uniref:Caspase domain-containing protein n=1 Tax=Lentzea waywayandensis TaxID=84724 RepID=A0A1I6FDV1_9PSEU|nr:caspase family protein [Lentzea waywayandensis]SFR28100.1 Caspase domain-containing protein [Lentzea waywayandensis]
MKRALLIGSQIQGLTGVHGDIELMDDALSKLGFDTIPSIEKNATTDAIFDRYRTLIQDSGPDDTVVVYYSGHGGRMRNPLADQDPTLPTWLQYIVPTDADDRSNGRARCVLAEELSELQHQLTEKTTNVTVILDCCHSARMSRRRGALPKATQLAFPEEDLVSRWTEVRARHHRTGDGNLHAVRVVACSPDQSAYEDYIPALGAQHGMLTGALVPLLTDAGGTITWLDALELMRNAVTTEQRPDVEGPAERLLFSLRTRDAVGVLPVRVENGRTVLPDAAIFGVARGDRYDLRAPGADILVHDAIVDDFVDGDAVLRHDGPAHLPAGTSAWPVEVALTRRPVAVVPPGAPRRDELAAELSDTAGVVPVEAGAEAFATARVEGDHVFLLDGGGEPLNAQPMSHTEAVEAVRKLAIAEHVRTLPSGAGDASLPRDVTVSYVRVLPNGDKTEISSGDHLHVGDRLFMRISNSSNGQRYACVFDIGLAGAVTPLTTSQPSGVTLAENETYELGHDWRGGIPLVWPETLPKGAPRLESFVTVIADLQVDRLGRLGQRGLTRGHDQNALEHLVTDLAVGTRDVPRLGSVGGVRWRVERFDFLLHPTARPTADEPGFEIDERPDPSLRSLTPRGTTPPTHVSVRLKELTVHNNLAFLKSRVRVDAVVITAAQTGDPYRASTMRFDRIGDGHRLPFDDVLIYDGPVARFLDIAIWVAKDDTREADLADLLVQQTADKDVAAAIVTLAALAVAAPAAAAVAGGAAAVAVLVRTAAKVLTALQGKSIGVYRTTLLPHQAFGAVDGVGRHPAQGLIKAQDMSFAFEVIAAPTA